MFAVWDDVLNTLRRCNNAYRIIIKLHLLQLTDALRNLPSVYSMIRIIAKPCLNLKGNDSPFALMH
jgi:hypothetical protein